MEISSGYYDRIVKFFKIPKYDFWQKYHVFPEHNYCDLALYQIGIAKCPPLHSFGPGIWKNFLLHFVLDGTGIYEVYDKHGGSKKKTYKLEKGQAFLIYPNSVVSYQADEFIPWQCVWLYFNGAKAFDYLRQAGLSEENHVYIPKCADNAYLELLCGIMEEPDNMIKTAGYMHTFFNEFINNSENDKTQGNTQKNNYNYIEEAVNLIAKNYWMDIKVTDIANSCGIERSYFYRLFKEMTGISPQEYLTKHRINNACEFLKRNELSIGDVARSVGYEDPLAFSKQFKKIVGQSPSDYRKRDLRE